MPLPSDRTIDAISYANLLQGQEPGPPNRITFYCAPLWAFPIPGEAAPAVLLLGQHLVLPVNR